MLGRFSTALQQAADVLAPPPPLFEDFVYYWKKLMNHYLDVTKTKPTPIELTNIPNHLEHLFQILLKEGETSDGVGPCMEYFLQHSLLDLLTTLASTDDPPGMKQHVLQLVAKLLNQSKHIDYGHSSVYSALQRLIGLCDGSTPTASESYEIQFLLSLSGILRRNYQLVQVFISHSNNEGESSTERRTSCSSSTSSDASSIPRNALFTTPLVPSARSCNVTLVPQPVTICLGNSSQSDSHPQFPIADAVLSYLDSPDTGVRLKACQALMLLVSLPDGTNTASLISSEVSLRLISRLVLLFYTIPHSTDPSHIDEMHLSWGLDIPTNDCTGCNGCKQAATFLSWFDYCDQVMIESNHNIAEAVSRRLSESFLGQAFNALALHKPINLTMLTKCFKMASSSLMNDALNEWLTCDTILNILLENWSSQDTDLAIETLRFFELVLEKNSDYVLDCLIWRYLKDRSFLNLYASESGVLLEDGNLEVNGDSDSEIHVIIKRWTNIVPKEIQSCNCGYEEYIGESMRQYQVVLSKVEFQQNAIQDLPNADAEFNEGPFLSALFTALSNIPKQAYELNLELTGIVSRLALRPETYLTEYLLNNMKQLKVRSLYSVLMGVATELANCITQFPDYQQTLADVRATLLGRSMVSLELKPDPWIGTFESIVVVEELCKELAAISYVKLKANSA